MKYNLDKKIDDIIDSVIDLHYFESKAAQNNIVGGILYKISMDLHCIIDEVYYDNNIIEFIYYVEKNIGKVNWSHKYNYNYNIQCTFRKNKIKKIRSLI